MATQSSPAGVLMAQLPLLVEEPKEKTKPLPRLRRDPERKPAFWIQDPKENDYAKSDRDFEIVKAVWENRFLSTSMLELMFPPSRARTPLHKVTAKTQDPGKVVRNRLQKLYHHHFLQRIELNRGGDYIYALDARGARLLIEHGLPINEKIDWHEKNRKVTRHVKENGNLYIDHALMVGRFRLALTLGLRNHPSLSLVSFERENEDLKIDFKYRGKRICVDPDAYFVLQDASAPEGRQFTPFLAEADRSTMDLSRMLTKQAKYALMFTEGHFQEKFKLPPSKNLGYAVARVLTFTKSRERAESLLRLPTRRDIKIDPKSTVPSDYKIPSELLPALYFTPELSYRQHHEDIFAEHWRRADEIETIRSIIRQPLPRKGDLVFTLDSDRQPKLI